MTKTLRNAGKAYNLDDTLKDEYSVTLNGEKYPLLTKAYKGYTSKNSKAGKSRFNKLFHGTPDMKTDYINQVRSALNMVPIDVGKNDVGDDTTNKNVSTKGKQNQDKNILVHSNLSNDKAPDSVEVFVNEAKEAEAEEKEEENDEGEETEQAPPVMRNAPVMRKGGKLKGKSHKEGGIHIEAEGGEFIVNKEATKHFEPELQQINNMGNNMGNNTKLRRRNTLNKMKRKFGKGGMLKYKNGGKVLGKSEIEQPSNGGGLMNRLSQDDGKQDTGLYQNEISKYFTKMDFTRTLKYVKNKNKDVENMGMEQLRDRCNDLARDIGIPLKYNGSVISKMKQQTYELLAIRLAKQQQPKKEGPKNVGLVVDMESVFGAGSELDKDKFAQQYMKGGRVDQEQVKQDMQQPEDMNNIVSQGKEGQFTNPKPEQKKAFQEFKSLNAGGGQEGALSRGETSYNRKTFNLATALGGRGIEMNWHHRYAQEIDEPKEQFQKPQSIFRYRQKNNKSGRRNLSN